jgi:hypothetical protein
MRKTKKTPSGEETSVDEYVVRENDSKLVWQKLGNACTNQHSLGSCLDMIS